MADLTRIGTATYAIGSTAGAFGTDGPYGPYAPAPAYPALPLYFESYTGDNNAMRWQNLGTLGGYMYTRGNAGAPGRVLTADQKPFYALPGTSSYDQWDIPNLGPDADLTFYAVLRGVPLAGDANGAYLIDWQRPSGGDRTILGYSEMLTGVTEIGTFYQSGYFDSASRAPHALNGVKTIITWVLQQGQPVRVYDQDDTLLLTSTHPYSRVALNGLGQPVGAGNLTNQSFGGSIGSGRTALPDIGGFAIDTIAHTTKAQRDAVRAKWRADLNF